MSRYLVWYTCPSDQYYAAHVKIGLPSNWLNFVTGKMLSADWGSTFPVKSFEGKTTSLKVLVKQIIVMIFWSHSNYLLHRVIEYFPWSDSISCLFVSWVRNLIKIEKGYVHKPLRNSERGYNLSDQCTYGMLLPSNESGSTQNVNHKSKTLSTTRAQWPNAYRVEQNKSC